MMIVLQQVERPLATVAIYTKKEIRRHVDAMSIPAESGPNFQEVSIK